MPFAAGALPTIAPRDEILERGFGSEVAAPLALQRA